MVGGDFENNVIDVCVEGVVKKQLTENTMENLNSSYLCKENFYRI